MARKRSTLRFGVKSSDGRRAGTWRVWANNTSEKADVFVACREMAQAFKASFHESGRWHVAIHGGDTLSNLFDADQAPINRFLTSFQRPREYGGITTACKIFIPWSAVRIDDEIAARDIVWLPSAPPGKALEVYILLSNKLPVAGDWPGRWGVSVSWVEYHAGLPELRRPEGWATLPVGTISLPSGGSVQVVYRTVAFEAQPPIDLPQGHFAKGFSTQDLTKANLRAVLWAIREDGVLEFLETGVSISENQGAPSAPG